MEHQPAHHRADDRCDLADLPHPQLLDIEDRRQPHAGLLGVDPHREVERCAVLGGIELGIGIHPRKGDLDVGRVGVVHLEQLDVRHECDTAEDVAVGHVNTTVAGSPSNTA